MKWFSQTSGAARARATEGDAINANGQGNGAFNAPATRWAGGGGSVVLPVLVSLRGFLVLWLFALAIVSVSVLAVRSAQVPEYAYGPAVAFFQPRDGRSGGPEVAVAVMLPPEYKGEVRRGQKVLLRLDQGREPLVRSVAKFDSRATSPDAAARRYNLGDTAASVVTQPVVVAVVPLDDLPGKASAKEYVGGVYAAEIETGSRSAFSMFSEPIRQMVGGWV